MGTEDIFGFTLYQNTHTSYQLGQASWHIEMMMIVAILFIKTIM